MVAGELLGLPLDAPLYTLNLDLGTAHTGHLRMHDEGIPYEDRACICMMRGGGVQLFHATRTHAHAQERWLLQVLLLHAFTSAL